MQSSQVRPRPLSRKVCLSIMVDHDFNLYVHLCRAMGYRVVLLNSNPVRSSGC